jgi:hypothetical protein
MTALCITKPVWLALFEDAECRGERLIHKPVLYESNRQQTIQYPIPFKAAYVCISKDGIRYFGSHLLAPMKPTADLSLCVASVPDGHTQSDEL